MQLPLFKILGFKNAQGYDTDPGGYFDIVAYVSVAAATGAAAKLWCEVEYAI